MTASALDSENQPLDGSPLEFSICASTCPATVTDIDGNVYDVVNIGCRCWMAENLKTTKFRNGDLLDTLDMTAIYGPFGPDATEYCPASLSFCNSPAMAESPAEFPHDGPVYNRFAVDDPRGLCPAGWHVARFTDWALLAVQAGEPPEYILEDQYHLGGNAIADAIRDPAHWPLDPGANNSTGFNALPGRVLLGAGWNTADGTVSFWDNSGGWPTNPYGSPHTGFWVDHVYLGLTHYYALLSTVPELATYNPVEDPANGMYCRCVQD